MECSLGLGWGAHWGDPEKHLFTFCLTWGQASASTLLTRGVQASRSPSLSPCSPPTSQGAPLPCVGPRTQGTNLWLLPLTLQGGSVPVCAPFPLSSLPGQPVYVWICLTAFAVQRFVSFQLVFHENSSIVDVFLSVCWWRWVPCPPSPPPWSIPSSCSTLNSQNSLILELQIVPIDKCYFSHLQASGNYHSSLCFFEFRLFFRFHMWEDTVFVFLWIMS